MAEKEFDVVVVGSIFMDFFCYADRLPKPGETLLGTDFRIGFGGKGANQCVAAARLGSKTAFIGKIGKDRNGEQYYAHFKNEGVNVEGISIEEDAPTGATSIMVGASDGQNMIIPVPGATATLNENDILKSLSTIRKAKILLCQLEIPTEAALQALRLGKENMLMTIWNAAPGKSNLPLEMFCLAHILCLNESEASIITGLDVLDINGGKVAIQKLVSDFKSKNVILTFGAEGAILWDNEAKEFHHIKPPVLGTVVDTTGAGDCFLGTLAHCLAHGDNLYKATRKAVQNASRSVLTKGTQTSYPREILHE